MKENEKNTKKSVLDIRIQKSIDVLNFILEDMGLENLNQMSELLGYDRPEKLYKISRGENAISKNLATEINSKLKQYSVEFLQSGDFSLIETKDMKENKNTRKYNHYLYDLILFLKLNPKSFAESLGFDRTDRIYNVLKELNGVSSELANIISEKYPEIKYNWILTGEGEMITSNEIGSIKVPENLIKKVEGNRKTIDAVYEIQTIPVYDTTATLGLVEIFEGSESGNVMSYISIPNLPKSDGAIFMTGDSMYPLLKSGDIVALKIINKLDIIFGEMYYVEYYGEDGDIEFKAIKYVKRSELGSEFIQLASYNTHHESKDILLNRVKTIAIVNASVRYNRL